jgi:hypothetical protein
MQATEKAHKVGINDYAAGNTVTGEAFGLWFGKAFRSGDQRATLTAAATQTTPASAEGTMVGTNTPNSWQLFGKSLFRSGPQKGEK